MIHTKDEQADRIRYSKLNNLQTPDAQNELQKMKDELIRLKSIPVQELVGRDKQRLLNIQRKVIELTLTEERRKEHENLDNYNLGNQVSELRIENTKLKERIAQLEEENRRLTNGK